MNFLESLLQDIRYAGRTLRRSPGFAITAILALALGIGANTAIFTVVNTVLLQPLAYPEPERLVQLELSSPEGNGNITSIPKFMVWRKQSQVFQDVAAYDLGGPGVNLTGGDRPEQLKGVHVSAGFFRVFGARLVAGRTFSADEDRPGGPALVVITGGMWRRFGADPNLVGKSLTLGDEAYTVTGILDPSFASDPPADIYIPLRADPNSSEQAHYLRAAARLKPGISLEQAKAAMNQAAEEYKRKFPGTMGPKEGFTAEPLRDTVVGDVRKSLLVLVGAVSFVLLIACANVANLLLARATIRKREIAIRAAIGAGRGALIRQLLTESVLLSLAGGLLGLGLGYLGVRALLAINPGNIPRIGERGSAVLLDWRVLVFTFGVAALTGILFGLVPALNASRADLNLTLKESGQRAGGGLRQNKARSILVVAEMGLALVLLVGAALLLRTFLVLRGVNPGFDAHNVLTMQMSLTGKRFETAAGVNQLVREAERRVGSLPGVISFASTCFLPLEGGFGLPFTIEGRPLPEGQPFHGGGSWRTVSPRYFEVFRIPLLRGRMFTDRDDGGGAPVVLINEGLAKQFWEKSDAVGQRITIGKGIGPQFEEPPREIIGIVGDVRNQGLNNNPDPIMYVPVAQVKDGVTALNNRIIPITLAIRTNVEPNSLSKEIQEELRVASGGLPVARVRSMELVRGESTSRTDFNMTLLVIFAGVALLLAAIGIYGLIAYSVQQRTQEIGIRMALGASLQDVRKMVVKQGMTLALIGVLLGVGAALGLTRLMTSLLYGVKASDPVVLVSAAVALGAVALLATYVPARRASRVDPIVSLRYE
jgi:predicted permease